MDKLVMPLSLISSSKNNQLSYKVLQLPNLLVKDHQTDLLKFAKGLPIFQPSVVFDTRENADVHDESVRKSSTFIVNDTKLVQYVNSTLLDQFKKSDSELEVKLARDHITFIRYDEGDFFNWHVDHEKFVLNNREKWLEMHLVYCLEAAEEGGNLLIRSPPLQGSPNQFQELDIPYQTNGCVIFDKRMQHCSAPVIRGSKLIVTLDVLVSTREILSNDAYTPDLLFALDQPRGFMTYNRKGLIKLISKHPEKYCVFGLITVDGETKVYDCNGTVERLSGDFSIEHYDIENIIQGSIDAENIPSRCQPLPDDVKIDFSSLFNKDTDLDNEVYEITYHCNESNYGSYDVTHVLGIWKGSA